MAKLSVGNKSGKSTNTESRREQFLKENKEQREKMDRILFSLEEQKRDRDKLFDQERPEKAFDYWEELELFERIGRFKKFLDYLVEQKADDEIIDSVVLAINQRSEILDKSIHKL